MTLTKLQQAARRGQQRRERWFLRVAEILRLNFSWFIGGIYYFPFIFAEFPRLVAPRARGRFFHGFSSTRATELS